MPPDWVCLMLFVTAAEDPYGRPPRPALHVRPGQPGSARRRARPSARDSATGRRRGSGRGAKSSWPPMSATEHGMLLAGIATVTKAHAPGKLSPDHEADRRQSSASVQRDRLHRSMTSNPPEGRPAVIGVPYLHVLWTVAVLHREDGFDGTDRPRATTSALIILFSGNVEPSAEHLRCGSCPGHRDCACRCWPGPLSFPVAVRVASVCRRRPGLSFIDGSSAVFPLERLHRRKWSRPGCLGRPTVAAAWLAGRPRCRHDHRRQQSGTTPRATTRSGGCSRSCGWRVSPCGSGGARRGCEATRGVVGADASRTPGKQSTRNVLHRSRAARRGRAQRQRHDRADPAGTQPARTGAGAGARRPAQRSSRWVGRCFPRCACSSACRVVMITKRSAPR